MICFVILSTEVKEAQKSTSLTHVSYIRGLTIKVVALIALNSNYIVLITRYIELPLARTTSKYNYISLACIYATADHLR